MSRLRSRSREVRLNIVLPVFCISLVSRPAKTTRPKHHLVFLRMHPLNNILSLSIANLDPFQWSVPSNLVRLLLGASQIISPSNLSKMTIFGYKNDNFSLKVENFSLKMGEIWWIFTWKAILCHLANQLFPSMFDDT